jgi:hypothetical protein
VCSSPAKCVIHDAYGQPLTFVYFKPDPANETPQRLPHDEAQRIASNIAKLPAFIEADTTRQADWRYVGRRWPVVCAKCGSRLMITIAGDQRGPAAREARLRVLAGWLLGVQARLQVSLICAVCQRDGRALQRPLARAVPKTCGFFLSSPAISADRDYRFSSRRCPRTFRVRIQ